MSSKGGDAGFTLLELLVALSVMMIGVVGVLAMYASSMRATSYSRHATEAIVLGEDKLEELIATPFAALASCGSSFEDPCHEVNAHGELDPETGFAFRRWWLVEPAAAGTDPALRHLRVFVGWRERGPLVVLEFVSQRVL